VRLQLKRRVFVWLWWLVGCWVPGCSPLKCFPAAGGSGRYPSVPAGQRGTGPATVRAVAPLTNSPCPILPSCLISCARAWGLLQIPSWLARIRLTSIWSCYHFGSCDFWLQRGSEERRENNRLTGLGRFVAWRKRAPKLVCC
jgi:hypothetical protein